MPLLYLNSVFEIPGWKMEKGNTYEGIVLLCSFKNKTKLETKLYNLAIKWFD